MVGAPCGFTYFPLHGLLGILECYLGCWLTAELIHMWEPASYCVWGVWMWGGVWGTGR